MAKHPPSKGATSRIRFIMLDAEIPEGDLNQLTSAIQNALRPAAPVSQPRLRSVPAPSTSSDNHTEAEVEENDNTIEDVVEEPSKSAQSPRVRKPSPMKVLDIDLVSEPSLVSFTERHEPKNNAERNLVALAWFKESRPVEVVTANHIYTCYRAMKWPSGIDDFSSALRSLKAGQFVKSVGRGSYEINHLGLARVEKLDLLIDEY